MVDLKMISALCDFFMLNICDTNIEDLRLTLNGASLKSSMFYRIVKLFIIIALR